MTETAEEERRVESGEWRMESGEWRIDVEKLRFSSMIIWCEFEDRAATESFTFNKKLALSEGDDTERANGGCTVSSP